MKVDKMGFLYPSVDLASCIECHLCESVCPVIHQGTAREPLAAFAAINQDEDIRLKSSSGGIFTQLATIVFQKSGVVYGAMFNKHWEVIHDSVDSIEDIARLRGSKYVQSNINDSFLATKFNLDNGRIVLFSGTPCQISALRLFLKKDYTNLILVDVACHGVPSPLVWNDYLKEFGVNSITSISFRDKRDGWNDYAYVIKCGENEVLYQCHRKNIYSQGFLNDLTIRPSCFDCPAKAGKSGSDITLADFWGINSINCELNDNKGINLLLANTSRGLKMLYQLEKSYLEKVDYAKAIQHNPAIVRSVLKPKSYDWFWRKYPHNGVNTIARAIKRMQPTCLHRIASRFVNLLTEN